MIKRFFFVALILCLFLTSFVSCEKKDVEIVFDKDSIVSLDPELRWAVVSDPYTACREDHYYDAVVTEHYRRGVILQVIGEVDVKIDDDWEKWYAFDKGWIAGSALDISSNRMRAETVSKNLLKNEN